jgi:hypothetical protein
MVGKGGSLLKRKLRPIRRRGDFGYGIGGVKSRDIPGKHVRICHRLPRSVRGDRLQGGSLLKQNCG